MKRPVAVESASAIIDARIKELGDWRAKTLAKVRTIIHAADPEIVEEWKWVKPTSPGTPVFSHGGIVCTGETYKKVVKMTFAKGAALQDPSGLFNSSLDGNVRRAIDIHEGDKVDEAALKVLIRAAVALNLKGKSKPKPPASEEQAGRLASSQVPAISPPIGEELRHLPHTPSSSASRPRAGRRRALGLDRGGDCHVYGTSIWRSSVSRAKSAGAVDRLERYLVFGHRLDQKTS